RIVCKHQVIKEETMGEISDNLKAAPRARKVMNLAQQIVQQHRHDAITPEHILLALIEEDDGIAAQVLMQLGIDLEQLRAQIDEMLGSLPVVEEPPEIVGMTAGAKKVMAIAIRATGALRQRGLGGEHLLLGIMHEEGGPSAAEALRELGL